MRLDHLSSVGPPYFVNQVVQPHASGPTEHKWSKRTQVVQAEERRREPTGPFSPGVVVRDRGRRGAVRAGAVRGGGGRVGPVLVERCIPPSRCAFCTRKVRLEVPARVQSARLGTQGSGPGRSRSGVIAEAAVRAGDRGGAGCPNLLQRPRSSRDARGESLIFHASSRRRSRSGTPLQQIRTRPRPEPPQAPHPRPSPPHHRSGQRRVRAADHHRAARQRRPRRRGRLARHSGDAPPRLDPGPDPLHPRGARGRSQRRPRRARLVSAWRIVHSEQTRKDVRTRGGSRPRARSPRR